MAKGKKTGGKDFKPGKSGNPDGMTKEQAKVRHLTREKLKDLMNVLLSATHEEMQTILERQDTTALTMMVIRCYMTAIETGDMKSFNTLCDRLVGKVKDEVELGWKPQVLQKRDGTVMEYGMKRKEEAEE